MVVEEWKDERGLGRVASEACFAPGFAQRVFLYLASRPPSKVFVRRFYIKTKNLFLLRLFLKIYIAICIRNLKSA